MLKIDVDQVLDDLNSLSQFSDAPSPNVTRVLFTETDLKAREWFKKELVEAGLVVREDAIGNIFGRLEGTDRTLPAIATGSHNDAIPYSGMFDGTVGVLGGLEAIRAIKRSGVPIRRSIELIMFTAEEPTRFGIGCLGSRLMAGTLSDESLQTLRDETGKGVDEVRTKAGYSGPLNSVRLTPGAYHGFIELHIEQGPLLEKSGIPIGIVTAIAAPASLRVNYQGPGGHAGAVLMAERADPLLAGAQLALHVNNTARTLGGPDTVATTGVLQVHPGAINSIPRDVTLEIDIRDIDLERRQLVLQSVQQAAIEFGNRHNVSTTVQLINADPPAKCDEQLIGVVEYSCKLAGQSFEKMISRAYHDSLLMAQVCPTTMIFIPCRNGVSHRPDEFASREAIEAGTRVLAEALALIATKQD